MYTIAHMDMEELSFMLESGNDKDSNEVAVIRKGHHHRPYSSASCSLFLRRNHSPLHNHKTLTADL